MCLLFALPLQSDFTSFTSILPAWMQCIVVFHVFLRIKSSKRSTMLRLIKRPSWNPLDGCGRLSGRFPASGWCYRWFHIILDDFYPFVDAFKIMLGLLPQDFRSFSIICRSWFRPLWTILMLLASIPTGICLHPILQCVCAKVNRQSWTPPKLDAFQPAQLDLIRR